MSFISTELNVNDENIVRSIFQLIVEYFSL